MNRPLLALGLVAAAVLLLSSLFADVRQEIEEPTQWTPDPDLVEQGAKAAARSGAGNAATTGGASADLLKLLQGGEMTLPEGTEIDGDLIRLLDGVQWTLPAGSELNDLSLPLPEGVGVTVPPGTTIDGDSLVFPPGSTLTLDDGTMLELPEGGRLTLPGLTEAQLRQAVRSGHVTTTEGSTFSAPRVVNHDEWPMTFPPGTEFRLPDGWTPPADWQLQDGKLTAPKDFKIPAGTEASPTGFDKQSQGSGANPSLFDRLGNVDLTPGTKAPGLGGLGGLGGIAGAWWLWVLLGVALLVGAYLLYRFRDRILPARIAAAVGATKAPRHPVRALLVVDQRPAGLPLAAAPGDTMRVNVRIENETLEQRPAEDDAPARRVRRWQPTPAHVVAAIGGRRVAELDVAADGGAFTLPALPAGDHHLALDVQVPGRRNIRLFETVRIAPWDEQVARDYQVLYDKAAQTLGLPTGFTPRTLEVALRDGLEVPDTAGALDAMISVFERANYSTTNVDRTDWLRFVVAAEAYGRLLDRRAAKPAPKASQPAPGDAPA